MKTVNLLAACCLAFALATASAQTSPVITVSSEDSLWLNKLLLTSSVSEQGIVKELGKPSRETQKQTEKTYYYDDLGLVVAFRDQKFSAIGINFNWDGDKKFPEKSYTGRMMIGKTEITRTTTKEVFEKLDNIKVVCPIPNICATADKNAGVKALAGFENNAVTQITFLLK